MSNLIKLAKRAGIIDLDALLLARPDLPPADAIADLRARFPAAFPKSALDMTDSEYAELSHKLLRPQTAPITADQIGDCRVMTPGEFARAKLRLGISTPASEFYKD